MNLRLNFTLFTSVLCSFFFSNLFAQQDNSIFYLRNGSVYIGKVLNDEDEDLDVKLSDGNQVNFLKSDVRRYLDSQNITIHPKGKYNVTQGFFFHTNVGMNLESFGEAEDEEAARVSSHTLFIFGWHLNPRIAVAAGFGFEFNQAEVSGFEFDTQFASQFLYGRYYLNNKKRRPFAYSRIGYGFRSDDSEFNDDNNGGFQFQAGAGLHFSSRKRSKFVLSLGYHFQKTDGKERFIDQFGGEISTNYDILIRRVMINFAIEFNKVPKRYRERKKSRA